MYDEVVKIIVDLNLLITVQNERRIYYNNEMIKVLNKLLMSRIKIM